MIRCALAGLAAGALAAGLGGCVRLGTAREYYPGGREAARYTFRRDAAGEVTLEGLYLTWYPDGRRKSAEGWRDGRRDGHAVYWNPDGAPCARVLYDEGRPVAKVAGPGAPCRTAGAPDMAAAPGEPDLGLPGPRLTFLYGRPPQP